ncbi:sugar ABC transporter permease [Cellulomonas sp. APG4]|uniref:sugar ABC transporter permease n=1 Tax=Cellulomonas sp. APG4 TaxID=1538656 RepID=UPI00137A4F9A|nr:sugar ABC transporter permease [Cellulomonas sp. APG4]NCT89572.1 sugar ABC transporter permease [Cellulomonas sp. APG4]
MSAATEAPVGSWRHGGPALGSWRRGELGSRPVIGGLLVLWLVFQAINPTFLSPDNLVNLSMQLVALGVTTLGVVLVLVAGEIDLSVGAVNGLASAVLAVTFVQQGWPLWVAVLVAVLVGCAIGLVHGALSARLGLPSFVVTLAGLLVALGLQIQVLGSTGTVNLAYESWLVRFAQQTFLDPLVAYLVVVVVVAVHVGGRLVERRRRLAAELPAAALSTVLLRSLGLGVLLAAPVWYLSLDRGVAATFVLLLVLVTVAHLLLRRTRWGRGVHAVGSSAYSARRAGLPVGILRLSCFVAGSGLAALGGVLATARLAAANQGSGGSELMLTAIAAAVIGGTSLFGGRGTAWSAVLGALVIQSISSGLILLDVGTSARYVVTGVVLVLAIAVDAVGRRSATPVR